MSGVLQEPALPFVRYRNKVWDQVRATYPQCDTAALGEIIANMWRHLPEQEKQVYQNQYNLELAGYYEAMKISQAGAGGGTAGAATTTTSSGGSGGGGSAAHYNSQTAQAAAAAVAAAQGGAAAGSGTAAYSSLHQSAASQYSASSSHGGAGGAANYQQAKAVPKPPARPLMPYIRYTKKVTKHMKAQNPNITFAELGQMIGQKWKSLTPEEKSVFEQEYETDKIRYQEELKAYNQQGYKTPSKIVSSKDNKNGPKKPLMPYMRFSKKIWPDVKAANPGLKVTQIGELIGQRWRELQPEEKHVFEAEYEADKQRYQLELKSGTYATGASGGSAVAAQRQAAAAAQAQQQAAAAAAQQQAAAAAAAQQQAAQQQQAAAQQQQAAAAAHHQQQLQLQQQLQAQQQYLQQQQVLQQHGYHPSGAS